MNNLKRYRGQRHQGVFVSSLGIPYMDRPLYSKIENGLILPTPKDAQIIAEKLGVKISDIWPNEPLYVPVHGRAPNNFSCACASGSNAKNYSAVIPHIPIGKQNAVSWKILSARTGLRERHIRQLIEDARNDGVPVSNYGGGYYIIDEREDAAHYYHFVYKTALSYLRRLWPLRKIMGDIDGQLSFGFCLRCGEPVSDTLYCDPCEEQIERRRSAGTVTTAKE